MIAVRCQARVRRFLRMNLFKRQVSLLRRTVEKFTQDEATDLASSIAFYAFFGLFPLILAVIAVAGMSSSPRRRGQGSSSS